MAFTKSTLNPMRLLVKVAGVAVAAATLDRDHRNVVHVEARRDGEQLAGQLLEHQVVVADGVELVDHRDDGPHPQLLRVYCPCPGVWR